MEYEILMCVSTPNNMIMKGNIYRKVLIALLFFDVIAILATCMIFYQARKQATESRTPPPTPASPCCPPELDGDPDWSTVSADDHFGPV